MYGKVFTSLYEGSMVGKGCGVFTLWVYCIAKADPIDHIVTLNPKLLCSIFGAKESVIIEALKVLTSPDEDSRCPDEDGRRLLHKGGHDYYVVTHEKYRDISTMNSKREYDREMKRRQREREKSMTVNDTSMTVNDVNLSLTCQKSPRHPVSVSASVSGEGESEGEVKIESYELRLAKRLYGVMEDEGVNMTRALKIEAFIKLVRDNPDTNWKEVVNASIAKDLNGELTSPLAFMAALCRGGKYIMTGDEKRIVKGHEDKKNPPPKIKPVDTWDSETEARTEIYRDWRDKKHKRLTDGIYNQRSKMEKDGATKEVIDAKIKDMEAKCAKMNVVQMDSLAADKIKINVKYGRKLDA